MRGTLYLLSIRLLLLCHLWAKNTSIILYCTPTNSYNRTAAIHFFRQFFAHQYRVVAILRSPTPQQHAVDSPPPQRHLLGTSPRNTGLNSCNPAHVQLLIPLDYTININTVDYCFSSMIVQYFWLRYAIPAGA